MIHNKIKNYQTPKELRLNFFDNLRTLFVFGVVFQHAGMAYIWSDWWPVTDSSSIIVACFVALFDGFLMPSLFYIAGFFAIPSIRGKSISQFLLVKFKRLLVPWLVCILFVCPLLPLIYHYTRDGFTLISSYSNIWLKLMGNAARFDVGIMQPMDQIMQNDLFYQRYMWFIGLLAAFFVIFSLAYRIKKEWFLPAEQSFIPIRPIALSTLKIALGVGGITFLGSTCLIGLMFALCPDVSNPESWFTFGNIIQFRVSRIFLHATYFILGILTYKKNWFKKGWLPGHQATWIILFLFVTIGFYVSLFLLRMASGDIEKLYGMIHWFFLNFFTVSALGLCISTACKYWNRPTHLNRALAANSYYLYLSHYVFVFFFQLLFIQFTQVPVILKYTVVSVLALTSASLFSRYLIKPYPKLTIASVGVIFLLMVSFIHP
jgi:glucan biosynthesis protein C